MIALHQRTKPEDFLLKYETIMYSAENVDVCKSHSTCFVPFLPLHCRILFSHPVASKPAKIEVSN